jgi:hypothetical protein
MNDNGHSPQRATTKARCRALYDQVRASVEAHFGHSLTITVVQNDELLVGHNDVGDQAGFLPELSTTNEVGYRVAVHHSHGALRSSADRYGDDDNHVRVMLDTVRAILGHHLPGDSAAPVAGQGRLTGGNREEAGHEQS